MSEATPKPLTAEELVSAQSREFIMIAGKDGVGKSSALVSQAKLVEELQPESSVYVIDTENKFQSALKAYGADYPRNIQLYRCGSMNDVTATVRTVLQQHKPGDWLMVESLARAWEYSQDLAYRAIAGVGKIEFLEMEEGQKTAKGVARKGSPIPSPDDFWNIAKGAHEGAFFTPLVQASDLNCIFTTTVKRPADRGAIKESADKKAIRMELGIDVGLDGAPRIPYYVETMVMLEMAAGAVSCRVLRDNLSLAESPRMEFDVPDKKAWAMQFYSLCRS